MEGLLQNAGINRRRLSRPARPAGVFPLLILLGLLLPAPIHALGPVTGTYLLSFHGCDSSTANCSDPRNHKVYLAQGNDGAAWTLVPGWTPYSGSVPDVIRRGDTLYIYTPGQMARYHLSTNVLDAPTVVTIAGLATGFVDPSLILDSQGRLTLFFLYAELGGDPAGCTSGQTTCQKKFGSATEVAGSDGSQFTLDGDRATVTLNTNGPVRSASDPDIFFDGSRFVLYISQGSSISVWTSSELRGSYIKLADLSNNTGGIPSGHFDPASQRYWTFAHMRQGNAAVIRRAVHPDLNRTLAESDWTTVVSAASLGLGASVTVESPGFALNTTGTAAVEADLALSKTSDVERVEVDGTMIYRLTATNRGPGPASGVRVVDALPPEISLQSATTTAGTCSSASSTVTCTVGDLARDATAVIELRVKAITAGAIQNTAAISGTVTDSNSANNSSTVSVTAYYSLYFPQVADGGGFSTTVTLPNTTAAIVRGVVRFFNPDGTARTLSVNGVPGSQFDLSIPAAGLAQLKTGNRGPALAGWARVESDVPLSGLAVFDLRDSSGKLVTTAAVTGSRPARRFALPVETGAGTDTGIALAFPARTGSTTVRLRLLDSAGIEAGQAVPSSLNPLAAGGHVAGFVSAFFSTVAGIQDFRGTLLIEPQGQDELVVTGLVLKEGLLSVVAVILLPAAP